MDGTLLLTSNFIREKKMIKLNRVVFAIALGIAASPINAEGFMLDCHLYSKLAAQIMEARQAVVPMQKILNTLNEHFSQLESPKTRQLVKKINKEIVLSAYEVPLADNQVEQKLIISEFQNKWAVACHRGTQQ